MRSILHSAATVAVFGLLASGAASQALARSAPDSFADLTEKLSPAVVNISTTQFARARGEQGAQRDPLEEFRDFFNRRGQGQGEGEGEGGQQQRPQRRQASLGSGFIIDKAGYIVTNNHVVEDADQISVILEDDTVLEATVVGRDDKVDVALLKVEPKAPLTAVNWGNSDSARVGDWVMAIGNPFGLSGTVTAGIISARARNIQAGNYDDFIQTDAAINRGNSGGPLFNMAGQVIGVNTAIFSPSGGSVGVGFAASANLIRPVVEDLRKYGRTRRGWIGVRIQGVTDEIAQTLGLGKPRGALVSDVTEGGPAVGSGLASQDVILTFDGRAIDKMNELPRVVATTAIDKTVDVVIWRNGKQQTVKLKVGELPDEALQVAKAPPSGETAPKEFARSEIKPLGLTVVEISEQAREKYGVPANVKGLMVVEVDETSDAALKGLRPGDIIDGIQQANVLSMADADKALNRAKEESRSVVLLRVMTPDRGTAGVTPGAIRYVPVKVMG
ncbi:MAG: Do family serine endopeptidase [Rhodospirillaceae bacterium]